MDAVLRLHDAVLRRLHCLALLVDACLRLLDGNLGGLELRLRGVQRDPRLLDSILRRVVLGARGDARLDQIGRALQFALRGGEVDLLAVNGGLRGVDGLARLRELRLAGGERRLRLLHVGLGGEHGGARVLNVRERGLRLCGLRLCAGFELGGVYANERLPRRDVVTGVDVYLDDAALHLARQVDEAYGAHLARGGDG